MAARPPTPTQQRRLDHLTGRKASGLSLKAYAEQADITIAELLQARDLWSEANACEFVAMQPKRSFTRSLTMRSPPPDNRQPCGPLSATISTRLDAQRFEAGNHVEQLLIDTTLAQTVE